MLGFARNDANYARTFDPAARIAPEVMRKIKSLPKEGAGKAGRRMHPQPRVQNKKAHEQVTTGSPETIRPSLRNGFNGLFRALPGEPGFVATIPSATRKRCRRVDASVGASGPHVYILTSGETRRN